MKYRQSILNVAYRLGLLKQLHRVWGRNCLTVLAYHRVTNFLTQECDTFIPGISAVPEVFESQMSFLKKNFNPVALSDVISFLRGEAALPAYPVLVTFDDGYRDIFSNAWPILNRLGIQATLFLSTDYIGKAKPFFWDMVAYCFKHTSKESVDLPFFGHQTWETDFQRMQIVESWVNSLRHQSNNDKETAVQKLPELLEVSIPESAFNGLLMSWDEVLTMSDQGMEFGAHTQSHPFLSRVSLDQAEAEIVGSQKIVEEVIGKPVAAFAFPGGKAGDISIALETILANAGFEAAFTLIPGPNRHHEIQKERFTLRRIMIGNRDNLARFAAKVYGLKRLIGVPR